MSIDYEMELELFYRSVVKEKDMVIDIGAHSGRHTAVFASLVGLHGSVIAFEPNPNIIKLLKKRAKYWIDNKVVSIKQLATSNENKRTTFIVANERPEESGLKVRRYNGPTTTSRIDVTVVKLDSLINEVNNLRFIKIDTEGAEYHTLLGAKEIIRKFKPIIAFEFGESSYSAYSVNPLDVYSFFESLDYKLYSINGCSLDQENFVLESRNQIFWDYIACHEDDIQIVENAFNSIINTNKEEIIVELKKLYKRMLNREADIDGLHYYTQKIISNSMTLEMIEHTMANSEEYKGINK